MSPREGEGSATVERRPRRERMSYVLVWGACSKDCSHVGRKPLVVVLGRAFGAACYVSEALMRLAYRPILG